MNFKLSTIRLVAILLACATVATALTAAARTEPATNVAASPKHREGFFHVRRVPVNASFTLAGDAKIRLGSNPNAVLTDLKPGQTAHVSYTIENGLWLAHEVTVNPTHDNKSSSESQTNHLHAHGRILAYNPANGNLTIRFHP